MSRCYPYPPPGYQKKAQQPELSLPTAKRIIFVVVSAVFALVFLTSYECCKAVQKEKHKSKDREKRKDGEKDKEKKEKKDREKKEKDKEKKDKDKSKDRDKDKEKKDKDKEKKDRDKDKESKREKRKKDGEVNGTSNGDKDPRSSKLQRTELLHSTEENGRVREIKTAAAVVSRPVDRDGKDAAKPLGRDGKDAAKTLEKEGKDSSKPSDRDGKDAAKPRAIVGGPGTRPSSMYSKEQLQPNGKVDRSLPTIVLSKPVTGGNQSGVKVEEAVARKPAVKLESAASSKPVVKVEEASSSSRPSGHTQNIDSSSNSGIHRPSKLPDFSVCDTMPQRTSWSAIDDEEWLTPSTERVPQKPKAEAGEDTSQQVWADAIFMPSVDMYALPYVVPY
ncbi:hypothetical protein R1sor_006694 [Riccia sorocarpa]|uniref:Uncharacterized protein n=1 Tax=Riccia sorocarpa TaxID=122646 RepID=A0ABD3HNS3_9MARC